METKVERTIGQCTKEAIAAKRKLLKIITAIARAKEEVMRLENEENLTRVAIRMLKSEVKDIESIYQADRRSKGD